MLNYDPFIQDFSDSSPFEEFYKNGAKSEDIKKAIISSFEPYFCNNNRLVEYSTSWLVSGWVNFMKLKSDEWYFEKFEECLKIFNEAKVQNAHLCYATIVDWVPEINQGLTKFWSFKNLSHDLETLEFYEFSEECLKLIGQLIEGIIKIYFKLLLQLNRQTRKKQTSKDDIDKLNFGAIIDELMATTNFPDFFCPPPWNIRLNQWRNIAYHHNAKVENSNIICWYGKEPNIKEISLSREDLFSVLKSIIATYNTVKNVEVVFVFDNLPEYQEECKNRNLSNVNLREEVELMELFSGINSQGFEIISFSENDGETYIIVKDLTGGEAQRRAIHSSQFLYMVWFYTNSHKVTIEYKLSDDKTYLVSSTTESICEKIADGTEDISYLAENIQFNLVKGKGKNV